MKVLVRVAFLALDGIYHIRLYWKTPDLVEKEIRWPDGKVGTFAGYTLNRHLKYKEVLSAT